MTNALIFRYGLRRPDKQATPRLIDEMRLANRYYNALVEIYRRKCEAFQAARRRLYPDFEALETREAELSAELAQERALVKSKNASERRRTADPVQRLKIAKLAEDLALVRAELKEQRAALRDDPALKAASDQINAAANDEIKAARKSRECSWGTGGAIEESVDQAAKKSHGMPRFRRWDGGGKFVVQIQGGMSIDEAFSGEDTRLRIDELPHRETVDRVPRSHRMTTLYMRIGSDDQRRPVWVAVPLIYHRPLPPDARIKSAYIKMQLVGQRQVWEAGFVLSREEPFVKTDLATDGTVGIDVGWRLVNDGLRVALWAGSDGAEGELVLPRKWLESWSVIDERLSERSSKFNEELGRLANWIDNRRKAGFEFPEWFAERTQHLRQWRSPNRLWRLVSEWMNSRMEDDDKIFDWMKAWWRDERADSTSIEGLRRRLIHQREEIYRDFAVTLRRKYHTAHVEAVNWARMQRKAQPEEDEADGALKHYMRQASVGRLLELIREHLAETVGVPAKDTTRRCHVCGLVRAIDGRDLLQTCDGCGTTWDQDRNAAINLLRHASGEVPEPVS